jgi:Domain of unknown function (DUF4190)
VSDEPPIYDPFIARRAPAGAPAPPAEPAVTSGLATASLVFGIIGFLCLPAVGGLLALTFGIAAKNEIARSEGTRTGSGMAMAGAILGGLNLLVGIGLLVLLMAAISGGGSVATTPVTPPIVAPPPVAPLPTAPAPTATNGSKNATAPSGGASSREGGVTEAKIGSVDLVDVAGVPSLGAELDRQRKIAQKDGKKMLLWVVVSDCLPCNGVAASLPDPKMQHALENIRLVRVNAREYGAELGFLGVPVEKVPGFVLLADTNRPVDFVDGGEWDEDVARNIAPVLGNFVRGRYAKRRDPWRGNHRDDETTL